VGERDEKRKNEGLAERLGRAEGVSNVKGSGRRLPEWMRNTVPGEKKKEHSKK